MLVSAAAIAINAKFDLLTIPLSTRGQAGTSSSQGTSVERPSTEVRLSDDPALRTRAPASGHWTLSDPRFGTIKIPVAAGEVPLTKITEVLATRGFQVSIATGP